MAAASLTPRVRLMAVCDGVRESKTETNVFDLKGVRYAITANAFPFVPARLRLFLVLSNPRPGEYLGYVRVVNDRTDKIIFHGQLAPRPTFEANERLWATRAPIRCSFPEEGWYSVQIWFFQEQGSDVLKGELPFLVAKEDV